MLPDYYPRLNGVLPVSTPCKTNIGGIYPLPSVGPLGYAFSTSY